MKMGRRGPKTSMQCPLVSENVQLFDETFDNFARVAGRYGSTCSSLRGMSEMFHSLFDWIQSVPQRLLPAADSAGVVCRMDSLLFLRIACELEPLEVRRFAAL